jgi:hypothetical protein
LDVKEMAGQMLACSRRLAEQVCSGGLIYWFTQWQHLGVLSEAVRSVIGTPSDVIAWVKSHARPGKLYPSRCEQVAVFVVGDATPVRATVLERRVRKRTNVWTHPGGDRSADRRTGRKPVALIADLIKDCTVRGDIVLDLFAGSGTTMIAAERTGRRARLIESDPWWCDRIVRRWEQWSKTPARLDESAGSFVEVAEQRRNDQSGAGD